VGPVGPVAPCGPPPGPVGPAGPVGPIVMSFGLQKIVDVRGRAGGSGGSAIGLHGLGMGDQLAPLLIDSHMVPSPFNAMAKVLVAFAV